MVLFPEPVNSKAVTILENNNLKAGKSYSQELKETDITEDEIDEWEEVSVDECNRRRKLSLELDDNYENCKGGGHLDRFGYWTKD